MNEILLLTFSLISCTNTYSYLFYIDLAFAKQVDQKQDRKSLDAVEGKTNKTGNN